MRPRRVFVNATLSGVQQRNLSAAWGRPVMDRVGLIIAIFGQRARTREARLQARLVPAGNPQKVCSKAQPGLPRARGTAPTHQNAGNKELDIINDDAGGFHKQGLAQVEMAALEHRASRLVRTLDSITGKRGGFGEGSEVVSARCFPTFMQAYLNSDAVRCQGAIVQVMALRLEQTASCDIHKSYSALLRRHACMWHDSSVISYWCQLSRLTGCV